MLKRAKNMSTTGDDRAGFTIVELMIATVVFSLVMLICLTGMVQVSRAYYKGITHSRTQEAARNLMHEITEIIKLSGSTIVVLDTIQPGPEIPKEPMDLTEEGAGAFCAGNRVYVYVLDRKAVDDPDPNQKEIRNPFVSTDGACSDSLSLGLADLGILENPIDFTAPERPRSLLGDNMRLTAFSIEEVQPTVVGTLQEGAQLWRVNLSIVYGDQDLLDYKDDHGNDRVVCRPNTGAEFCSIVELSTMVSRRIGK